ncbi:MAG: hypothetical protein KA436_01800 [Oligoflexales bacterium]|nr:hypothetical protein [Oligoflexales bacterium]
MKNLIKSLNATLLVAGTCIGGGMLALPVMAGKVGLFPASVMMFLAWIFMTITGLFYLEATLWMNQEDAHLISISSRLLGRYAPTICWVIYLFIAYASLVAYLSGSGALLRSFTLLFFPHLSVFSLNLIYSSVFFVIIWLGKPLTENLNAIMTFLMFTFFFILAGYGASEEGSEPIMRSLWDGKSMFLLLPLLLTTFSYPGIVPVLVNYLDRDAKKVRISVIAGTSLTFLAYFIWMLVILRQVPYEGDHGLKIARELDFPATETLRYFFHSPMVVHCGQAFAFLAMATSFLGVSLGLYHFLSDGLKTAKVPAGKFFICLLISVPTLMITSCFDKIFFHALNLSGGLGDSLLSGLIPSLMVWSGRYRMNLKSEFQMEGGKVTLYLSVLFFGCIFLYEIIKWF